MQNSVMTLMLKLTLTSLQLLDRVSLGGAADPQARQARLNLFTVTMGPGHSSESITFITLWGINEWFGHNRAPISSHQNTSCHSWSNLSLWRWSSVSQIPVFGYNSWIILNKVQWMFLAVSIQTNTAIRYILKGDFLIDNHHRFKQ